MVFLWTRVTYKSQWLRSSCTMEVTKFTPEICFLPKASDFLLLSFSKHHQGFWPLLCLISVTDFEGQPED